MPRREDSGDDSPVAKDMARISKMADRLKLKGKQRTEYLHEHMTGLGYRTKTTYVHPDDDDDDNSSGSRYSIGRRRNNNDDDDDDDL